MSTAADSNRTCCDKEGKLDNRANVDMSAIGDKTISNAQIFEDAASYQTSDNDNSSIDSIQLEKQEDSRTSYFIYRRVMVKISLHRSRYKI